MTNEEIIEKISIGHGDKQQLLLQLYEQNKPLIRKVIRPYLRKHAAMDEDDLMQEAYFGVIEAAEHYDQDKGMMFSSYMIYWIRAAVNRPFYSMSRADSMPEHMVQRMVSYNRTVAQYRQQTGTDPPDNVLRHELKISQEQLEQIRQFNQRGHTASLSDIVPGTDGVTVADMIQDPDDIINELCEELDSHTNAAALWAEVDELDPRQAQAIRTYFQGGLSVREVADQLQITQGKARAAINKGCQKLARKRSVRQIARDYGYSSFDLFGGGFRTFLHSGTSNVESAVIWKLEGYETEDSADSY